jgi:diguanylate cyclase (GGDEF)-like protein
VRRQALLGTWIASVSRVTLAVLCAAASLLTTAVLWLRLRRSRLDLEAAEARGRTLERDLGVQRKWFGLLESEQRFLSHFLRGLPHFAHELHTSPDSRQIPGKLLDFVARHLEPRRALMAVRRRSAETDPDRHMRLAVAATAPVDCVPVGSEVRLGQGRIGFAAEVQRVMDRRDFETQPPSVLRQLEDGDLPGFGADLVAPLVFGGETVGVIALESPRRASAEAKDALRLVAQIGAVSIQTRARYSQMQATASLDGLTGAFNKRYLTHRIAEEVGKARDEASSLSVFLFDVDNFKHYNDANGHVAGDRLLQKLARIVQDNIRKDSVFGRFGGEEFVLVLPRTTRDKALAAAENLRQAIASHEFAYGFDQPLGCVSISGGVAEHPMDGADAAALLHAADEALYVAKRAGRNRVRAYEPRYLGGEEAQLPLPIEEQEKVAERVALAARPLAAPGEAVALAASEDVPANHEPRSEVRAARAPRSAGRGRRVRGS